MGSRKSEPKVSTKNDVDLEVVIQSLCNKITRGVEMKTRPHDLQS